MTELSYTKGVYVLYKILNYWILCKYNDNIKVSKQLIWNHFDICKNNRKTFCFDRLYQKGIHFIEHLEL